MDPNLIVKGCARMALAWIGIMAALVILGGVVAPAILK